MNRIFVKNALVRSWAFLDAPGRSGVLVERSSPTHAYVLMLCDDEMAMSTLTLARSLKETRTRSDVVVGVLPNVSSGVVAAIRRVGAIPQPFVPLPYPYTRHRSRNSVLDNKACRYSKLQVWNLTSYQKVIYLDADMLVLRNIDELFRASELSAVPDKYPGVFNTGLMVLEPSTSTYHDMLRVYMRTGSYNRGDQGFLNQFFSGSILTLSAEYNFPVWLKHSSFYRSFERISATRSAISTSDQGRLTNEFAANCFVGEW